MRCPKSRFPIRIIVFEELELIIFVSQGLTLSTASLVVFSVGQKGDFLEERISRSGDFCTIYGVSQKRVLLPLLILDYNMLHLITLVLIPAL